jgi:hypothetical protein
LPRVYNTFPSLRILEIAFAIAFSTRRARRHRAHGLSATSPLLASHEAAEKRDIAALIVSLSRPVLPPPAAHARHRRRRRSRGGTARALAEGAVEGEGSRAGKARPRWPGAAAGSLLRAHTIGHGIASGVELRRDSIACGLLTRETCSQPPCKKGGKDADGPVRRRL